MTTVLITGGAGFIGSRVADILKKRGHEVVIVDKALHEDHPHNINLEDPESVSQLVHIAITHKVDVFLHLAAQVGGGRFLADEEWQICSHNVWCDTNVMEAFIQCRIADRFVYCSSSMVFQNGSSPCIEKHTTHNQIPPPTNNYGFFKLAGERLTEMMCNKYGREFVIGRPFNVYGPGELSKLEEEYGVSHVIPDFHRKIRLLKSGHSDVMDVFGDGQQSRSFTWVEDTANAFALMCVDPDIAGETFNIASEENITMTELAHTISRMLDYPIDITYRNPWPGDTKQRVPDTNKIRRKLGWQPMVPFSVGLKRTLDWLDEEWRE
tara:strand:- start:6814 stop:7782 length:969 start_codon:yes stop_codon:yes gene_type:complete